MTRDNFNRQGPFILAIVASAAFFVYSMLSTGLAMDRPSAALFNGSILLLSSGCLTAIAMVFADQLPWLRLQLRLFTIATWAASATLLMSLCVTILMTGRSDIFSEHVFETWKFITFFGVVLFLLYGPDWLTINTTTSYRFAPFYDGFQLLLVPLILLTNGPGSTSSTIEEIFRLWLAVMLMTNGFEMARGRSSFQSNLSETARSKIPEDHTIYPPESMTVVRFGTILIASGLALALFTLVEFFG